MGSFFIALSAVAIMLLYSVPGFILVKTKAVKQESIPAFAMVLMYVCQPCLTVYSFNHVPFSMELLREMGIFFLLVFCFLCLLLGVGFTVIAKKRKDIRYRIYNIAAAFGNCAFMGIPLLEAIFPDKPEAITFSAVFLFVMSFLGWTAASAIIALDVKYINFKKILLNPSVLSLCVALPIFIFDIQLPSMLSDMITLVGRMSTPMCMLIMGMRLATVSIKNMIATPMHWVTVGIKQLVVPLVALGVVCLLPIDPVIRSIFVILSACPVASVVLNFAEMLGEGQETAADLVLLGTLSSVVTIPIITLLL